MALEARRTDELVRIAAAGGGFRLNAAPRTTEDLVMIAAAASNKRPRLIFSGMSPRTTEDLVRIAAAGNGAVMFEG